MTIRPRPADQDVLMAVVALAFFAGILTVAAPCSLPVLPALLGVSLGQGDKARPVLITMGFVVAFTAAAVFFSVTTQIAGIDQTAVRTAAAVLLAAFGALMLWPRPFEWFWNTARCTPHSWRPYRYSVCTGQPRRFCPRHWTYGCYNCINTLPHVTQLYDTYRDKGLVVVGVHTPEFPFEKSLGNLQTALKRHGIRYSVAQDNEYATWNAYQNQYWPAQYIIDQSGKIVFEHAGEGRYDEMEQVVRKLLDLRS